MKYREGEGPKPGLMPGLLDNNQQDYATQLNKALGLQVRPPGHIDPRISMGIQVDDFTRPEFNYLRRLSLMSVAVQTAAVAAQFPVVQVVCNAARSVVVLERMLVINGNAGGISVSWGWGGFDGGVTVTPESRDSRNYGNPGIAYITKQNVAAPAAPTPNAGYLLLAGSASAEIQLNQVIVNPTAGFATSPAFKILGNQVLTALTVTLFYRERSLLPQEIA
jgi:hypothetical protein